MTKITWRENTVFIINLYSCIILVPFFFANLILKTLKKPLKSFKTSILAGGY